MAFLEEDLKRIVCLHPELIEDGLVIEEEEFLIRGTKPYRCDLKGRDKNNAPVYIELKLTATHTVIGQILTYKSFAPEPGRFVVAALDFAPDVESVIRTLDIETITIDKEKAAQLLKREQNNPLLYIRKNFTFKSKPNDSARIQKKNKPSNLFPSYSEKETAVIKTTLEQLATLLSEPLAEYGLMLLQPAPHTRKTKNRDEYRLRFRSPISPKDEFVIYTRARIGDTVLFCYVPDFSLSTGKTPRKEHFRAYILKNRENIESIFGCTLFDNRHSRVNHGDLKITTQAWKGFYQTIKLPIEQWEKPDFIEMFAAKFIRFVENLLPFVQEFGKISKS